MFATVMTSRQFLSILLSCLIFMHPLSAQQWLGTALIFSALSYQTVSKSSKSSKPAIPAEVAESVEATKATLARAGEGSV